MSRISKWKLEKTKVKVVFRLQFHATHIPQPGWDKLFISFIPADSGKTTAKTTKASVRNGVCKWADPIYETTRLLQDEKSKLYEEKIYKLVITMGSTRPSILGEATINLAEYVVALKPTSVSLPLLGSDSGAILHVTIQLLTSKTGFREFEQQRELSERGPQPTSDHDSGKSLTEHITNNQIFQVSSRVKFRPEGKVLPSHEEEGGLNGENIDFAAGLDDSSNTSESVYAEKHDTFSTHEIDSIKSTVSGDFGGHSVSKSPTPEKGEFSRETAQSGDWAFSWGSGTSMDNDLAVVYQENSRLKGSLEEAEISIYMLKQEICSLQSNANSINVETKKLSEQLATEISSEQQLAKEIAFLKSECLRFRVDIEHLRNLKLAPLSRIDTINLDQNDVLQNAKLRWFNGLLLLEDRIRDLQKKSHAGYQESDFMPLVSDLEALLCVLQDLKQVPLQSVSPQHEVCAAIKNTGDISHTSVQKSDSFASAIGFGTDLCHPEGLLHCLSVPGIVSNDLGSVDAANAMQGEIFKLLRELDDSKVERESLVRKMDQMECYYEALIQELEGNQKLILGELQNLRNEHSSCVYTISSTKAQMEAMHQDMNDQILKLAEERCNLDSLNKELERRVVTSEAALRRARLNYSIAVNQLQRDLDVLSCQVLSMYETNENLIKKAFSEGLQPCIEGYDEALPSNNLDAEHPNAEHPIATKLVSCWSQGVAGKDKFLSGDMLLEDLKQSFTLQEEPFKKIEGELYEMHLDNIHLVVFAKALQEMLCEATADKIFQKHELHKLVEQLESSTKSNELLELKLQTAMDGIRGLKEDNAICFSKNNDLALLNKTIDENLKTVSDEKKLLNQRIAECEELVERYSNYRNSYETCATEKTKLANLLEQTTAENVILSDELSSTKEALQNIRGEFNELASSMESWQEIVKSLQQRLGNILTAYSEVSGGCPLIGESVDPDSRLKQVEGMVSQLEELQRIASERIRQLSSAKNLMEEERYIAFSSLASEKSKAEAIEQMFEHHVLDSVQRVDASIALVEKLQAELEIIRVRFQECSLAEEKFAGKSKELLSDFSQMESELQELIIVCVNLDQKVMVTECMSKELERSKLLVEELTKEKKSFTASLQSKALDLVTVKTELDNLKDTLRILNDELSLERSARERLEAEVSDLVSQLNGRCEKLLDIDQSESELLHLKELLLELELEKSRACHQFSDVEKCLQEALTKSSSVSYLESCLLDVNKFLIAADVKATYLIIQYKSHIQELVPQIESSDKELHELNKKCVELEAMLNNCRARESKCIKENEMLLSTLELVRSDIEVFAYKNKSLVDINSGFVAEVKDHKENDPLLARRLTRGEADYSFGIEQLNAMLADCQKEIDNLVVSKEEMEIKFLLVKEKFREEHVKYSGDSNDELVRLQKHCDELHDKLAEQVLKTEEFRNLSIHLKELNDKADRAVQAREMKEAEGPPVAMQESLRIAFLKEQYETKLQELRHQLSVSKRHGEEMLCKLQDAIDELEKRKRSEASHSKRNEEMSLKLMEMEADLLSIISDNREKVQAYDQMRAELECSLISLECCKEEKQKLIASLQECNDEKTTMADQVKFMKEMVESTTASMKTDTKCMDGCSRVESISTEVEIGETHQETSTESATSHGTEARSLTSANGPAVNHRKIKNSNEAQEREIMDMQATQDDSISRDAEENRRKFTKGKEALWYNDVTKASVLNGRFKSQNLISSMDQLQKELEKMKSENSILNENYQFEADTESLQSEMTHLEKVNEELRNMCPLFNDFASVGNSVERVLALELELAEALQAKKKSSFQFQSSFLKQHSDEAAVFRSFRDINELIKDMLELKEKYGAVEMELNEMHERYSQLSLQFAEVEGERQKLMMTLKNVRPSRKLLSHSSSLSPTKVL